MAFNINDYETVEVRLGKFIADYPDFMVHTELLEHSEKRFIVLAKIYRTCVDSHPFATGLAYEIISDRGVNSTSALENAQRAEELGLPGDRITLSCKVSGVQDLIAVYRELAKRCDYPLHRFLLFLAPSGRSEWEFIRHDRSASR